MGIVLLPIPYAIEQLKQFIELTMYVRLRKQSRIEKLKKENI